MAGPELEVTKVFVNEQMVYPNRSKSAKLYGGGYNKMTFEVTNYSKTNGRTIRVGNSLITRQPNYHEFTGTKKNPTSFVVTVGPRKKVAVSKMVYVPPIPGESFEHLKQIVMLWRGINPSTKELTEPITTSRLEFGMPVPVPAPFSMKYSASHIAMGGATALGLIALTQMVYGRKKRKRR
tara:strand:+ start:2464 stop:3003 length:540 start_codon:yes stop_codon:yes gene_type:complete